MEGYEKGEGTRLGLEGGRRSGRRKEAGGYCIVEAVLEGLEWELVVGRVGNTCAMTGRLGSGGDGANGAIWFFLFF